MEKEEIKINETHLIVLRKEGNSNIVKIDYEEIINPIRKELDYIYEISENNKYSLQDLENIISKNEDFKKILGYRNFCKFLSNPYQGISSSEIDYAFFFQIENKSEKELTKEEKLKLSQEKKNRLISEFKYRDLPYAIDKTYEKCNNDKGILAYSHRKVGWAMPKHNLVNNFSIQFRTNFGYGSVSYFYTKLKYKEIDIIPFSDWIIYQHAKLHEIIRYSVKHQTTNESWYEAMEYAKNAIDLFNRSEKEFINKYILNECESMVEGLENILSKHIFSFKQYNGKYREYEYKDKRLLIEFRGEKISGALRFISNIIEYNDIIEVQSFINTIIKLNKSIEPILRTELKAVCEELKNARLQFNIIKEKYEPVKEEYEFLSELKDRITNVIEKKETEIEEDNKTDIDACFEERHPKYIEIKKRYEELKEDYYKLNSLINQLDRFEKNYNKYITVIGDFMKKNNT